MYLGVFGGPDGHIVYVGMSMTCSNGGSRPCIWMYLEVQTAVYLGVWGSPDGVHLGSY